MIQDYTDYDLRLHHTNVDTAERVKIDDLKQNATVLASFVYQAAQRTEMIPRAKQWSTTERLYDADSSKTFDHRSLAARLTCSKTGSLPEKTLGPLDHRFLQAAQYGLLSRYAHIRTEAKRKALESTGTTAVPVPISENQDNQTAERVVVN